MSRRIIYLINPISGTRGKTSLQELIIRRTRAENIEFTILPTDMEGNYDFLLPVIEKEGVTDVVVCGGDGTVSAVAAALMGTPTRIGIIPTGSGNGLAFAAHIPPSPSKALDIIFAGKATPIDGFMINGHFSCMLCGIGFDAEVAHEFALQKKRGLQTYIRISFARFFHSSAYRFRISLPAGPDPSATAGAPGPQGLPSKTRQPPAAAPPASHSLPATSGIGDSPNGEYSLPVEAFFISVANGNQFGNNFTIAPKAKLDDGLLDFVVVKRMGKFHMVLAVLRQVLGGNRLRTVANLRRRSTILYFQAPELTIENLDAAPLHIDGEPRASAPSFVISIVPRAFTLIRP